MEKKSFLVISGPNLNLLGARKTSIYGEGSLEDIHKGLKLRAEELNVQVECRQLNREGDIIDSLQEAPGRFDGIIINAGALAHYSYALRGAVEAMPLPCVEVSIANVHAQEEFRHHSVIAPVCVGVIAGFGKKSYLLALQALASLSETGADFKRAPQPPSE